MSKRALLVSCCMSLLAAGCASAPRGPAATLAEAGQKTASAFGSDVRDVAAKLRYEDVSEAFTTTWQVCYRKPAGHPTCTVQTPGAVSEDRERLARSVELRANAIEALGEAYAALKTEAVYDARADLTGAAENAVTSVNAFAGLWTVGAPLVSSTIGEGIKFAAGIFAEQRQRRRILRASAVIGAATKRFREALEAEAAVFDTLAMQISGKRNQATVALLQAGLISRADIIRPMAEHLGVKLVPNADAVIDKSPGAQTAVEAALKQMSKTEAGMIQDRYRASLSALDALVAAHADLEEARPVSIDEVARLLTELDVALGRHLEEEGDQE